GHRQQAGDRRRNREDAPALDLPQAGGGRPHGCRGDGAAGRYLPVTEGRSEATRERAPEGRSEATRERAPEGRSEATREKTPEGRSEATREKTPEGRSE